MTLPTGILNRTDLATNGDTAREDLTNIVDMISPTERPFHQNAGRGTAKSDLHEWQIDALATAVTNNAHVDGDDFVSEGGTGQVGTGSAGVAFTTGNRLSNYMQISRKDIVVSRRADIIHKAGRRNELNYQVAKAMRELQRDCEAAGLSNTAGVAGSDTVAPRTAGIATWFTTNTDAGATGADGALSNTNDGYPDTARTDGTVRALTEDGLLGLIENAYTAGGDPDVLMLYPSVKQLFSNFMFTANARIATQYQDQGKSPRAGVTAVGAVDVYVSDFGVLDVVPNRFMRSIDALILEMDKWDIVYLDGYHIERMGKTGDSNKRVLLVDWGIRSRNEAGSALFTDINTAAAMTAS